MRFRIAFLLVAGMAVFWSLGCSWIPGVGRDEGPILVPVVESAAEVVTYGEAEGMVQPVELTRSAAELRRRRDEMSAIVAAMPATKEAVATPDAEDRHQLASARVAGAMRGEVEDPVNHEDWFSPERGVYFYRNSGGDWTTARKRREHPYSSLFYYDGYDASVMNFENGSMQRELARRLTFEVAALMPVLGEPSPEIVDLVERKLGWSIRDEEQPIVNVWSAFVLEPYGDQGQAFAIGGVMRLQVLRGGDGDEWYEYLVPGSWLGNVALERLPEIPSGIINSDH